MSTMLPGRVVVVFHHSQKLHSNVHPDSFNAKKTNYKPSRSTPGVFGLRITLHTTSKIDNFTCSIGESEENGHKIFKAWRGVTESRGRSGTVVSKDTLPVSLLQKLFRGDPKLYVADHPLCSSFSGRATERISHASAYQLISFDFASIIIQPAGSAFIALLGASHPRIMRCSTSASLVFVATASLLFAPPAAAFVPIATPTIPSPTTTLNANIYDDWRSDGVVPQMHLDEENVQQCLDELIESDYGQQMFGHSDLAAGVGITGQLEFVELHGPEVILRLSGAFWHRRETVLGRAAMYINARIPEVMEVNVEDPSELEDVELIIDEDTGEVLEERSKQSPDFNGDRATMTYQGADPDMRGPFPQGVGGLRPGGSMINPA